MKRQVHLLVLLLAMASALPAVAQNMKVASFSLLENDKTAFQKETMKYDQNGELAALIKILTPNLQNLTFDGGAYGIVGTEFVGDEVWLYVPAYTQHLGISHPTYGVLRRYDYPLIIEGGRTYRMLLDIGTGHYVTVTSQQPEAELEIDGQPAGPAPIANRYMYYGTHVLKAVSGRYEGTDTIFVSANDTLPERTVEVHMREMSDHYGQVLVATNDSASIWFEGDSVATGRWETELREGTYDIEVHQPGYDPAKTTFTVVAQQLNEVAANPPTPYTGRLSVFTRPRNVQARLNGRAINLSVVHQLPLGTYHLEVKRADYFPAKRDYTLQHNQLLCDTINLERRTWYNYIGPSLRFMGGDAYPTLTAGYVSRGTNIELNFGYKDLKHNGYRARLMMPGLRFGGRIRLSREVSLTPLVGFTAYNIYENEEPADALKSEAEREDYKDNYWEGMANGSLKLTYAPFSFLQFYVAPEYNYRITWEKESYMPDRYDVKSKGFGLMFGLNVTFVHLEGKK